MHNLVKAYQRVRITTAAPEGLVVMLCEGLVRFTASAADALDERRWRDAANALERAAEILAHLRESLREESAPSVVSLLDRTYATWTLCLLRAQIGRDAASVRALVPQMEQLCEAWREAAEVVGQGGGAAAGGGR